MNGIFYSVDGAWLCKICHARTHRLDCPIATAIALSLEVSTIIHTGAETRRIDLDLLATLNEQVRVALLTHDPIARTIPRRRATDAP